MAVFGARSEFIQWAVGLNRNSVIMGFRTVSLGGALVGVFQRSIFGASMCMDLRYLL